MVNTTVKTDANDVKENEESADKNLPSRGILSKVRASLGMPPDFNYVANVGGFSWYMRPIMASDRTYVQSRFTHPDEAIVSVSVYAIGVGVEPPITILEQFSEETEKALYARAADRLTQTTGKPTPQVEESLRKDIITRIVASSRDTDGNIIIHPQDTEVKLVAANFFYSWLMDSLNIDPDVCAQLYKLYISEVESKSPLALRSSAITP